MKSTARRVCWWPKLDFDIEPYVHNCGNCQATTAVPPLEIIHTDSATAEVTIRALSACIVILIRNIIVYIISYNNTESYCMYDHKCIVNSGNSVLSIRMLIAIYMRMTMTYFMNYGLKTSILHEIVAHNIHRSTIERVSHYIQFFRTI